MWGSWSDEQGVLGLSTGFGLGLREDGKAWRGFHSFAMYMMYISQGVRGVFFLVLLITTFLLATVLTCTVYVPFFSSRGLFWSYPVQTVHRRRRGGASFSAVDVCTRIML